jgi:hypothetical protein
MAENFFIKVLNQARQEKSLVCVFRDPTDLRRFAVGYVVAVGAQDYTLQQIDPDGNPDGLDVGALDDIVEVRRESRYTRQIALLMEHKDDKPPAESGWKGSATPESCLEVVLDQARRDKLVVNVLVATGDDEVRFFALVRELSESHVRFDVLTDDGESDGLSTLRLDDIAGLQVNTREERKIALFNRHRTHLYL